RRASTRIAATEAARATMPATSSAVSAAPTAMIATDTSRRPAPRHVIAVWSPGDRDPAHRALYGRHLGYPLDLRLRAADHAMSERGDAHILHIVRHDVVTALDRGHRLTCEQQRNRSARAGAERKVGAGPGCGDDRRDVAEHLVGNAHRGNLGPNPGERRRIDDRGHPGGGEVMGVEPAVDAAKHHDLRRRLGDVDLELEEEAIAEAAAFTVGRGLTFLHRLEQGGLSLGRSPVDLVGEEGVGEDRTFAE